MHAPPSVETCAKPRILRLARIEDVNTALGAAVRIMMEVPAFARRPFGQWALALDGMARRGHQLFVLDGDAKLVGFVGYALASAPVAEDWLHGRRSPLSAECASGDCLIFNAMVAADAGVQKFLWDACRELAFDKKAAFYKRFYADGSARPVKLTITDALRQHVARTRARHRQATSSP